MHRAGRFTGLALMITLLATLEREMIHQGLERTRYNKSRLSRELGISRSNLILKISKYGLDKPGVGEDSDEANA